MCSFRHRRMIRKWNLERKGWNNYCLLRVVLSSTRTGLYYCPYIDLIKVLTTKIYRGIYAGIWIPTMWRHDIYCHYLRLNLATRGPSVCRELLRPPTKHYLGVSTRWSSSYSMFVIYLFLWQLTHVCSVGKRGSHIEYEIFQISPHGRKQIYYEHMFTYALARNVSRM